MKTLLICPSIRPAVPQIAEEGPLVLTPVLGEPVVNHWIEHLAGLGARQITVLAADRAEQIRAVVGSGARWGVNVEVVANGIEPTLAEAAARYGNEEETGWLPPPHDIVVLDHLPAQPDIPLFESYGNWFSAALAWMPRALTPARVRVSELQPGIWVSRRARVSPLAELIAPCWIGDQVFVEAHAVLGPGAVVEDRAVIEPHARVVRSWISPDTFVGRMTSVTNSLAWGSMLVNWQTDSTVHVPDPFLLCSLVPTRPAAAPARPARSRDTTTACPAASPLNAGAPIKLTG